LSEYGIYETTNPSGLRSFLGDTLGVRGIVRKRRWLYRLGETRIHLDDVEGLGAFLELEVVLADDQSKEDGARMADRLFAELGIPPEDRIDRAYIDLLEEAAR